MYEQAQKKIQYMDNHECNLLFSFVLQQSSQYPAYALSAASAVPGGGIVVGTSSGTVYLVKSSSNEPHSLRVRFILSDRNHHACMFILWFEKTLCQISFVFFISIKSF